MGPLLLPCQPPGAEAWDGACECRSRVMTDGRSLGSRGLVLLLSVLGEEL